MIMASGMNEMDCLLVARDADAIATLNSGHRRAVAGNPGFFRVFQTDINFDCHRIAQHDRAVGE